MSRFIFLLCVLLLIGGACVQSTQAPVVNESAKRDNTATVSEQEYYNITVEAVNVTSEGTAYIREAYDTFTTDTAAHDDQKCTFQSPTTAQKKLTQSQGILATREPAEDFANKEQLDSTVEGYEAAYVRAVDAADQLYTYCDDEEYVNDGGEGIAKHDSALHDALTDVTQQQEALLETLSEYQSVAVLSTSADTTDPQEYAVVMQTAVSAAAEDAHNAYNAYGTAFVESDHATIDAAFATLQEQHDALAATYEDHRARATELYVFSDPVIGSAATAYSDAAEAYIAQLNALREAVASGALTRQTIYDADAAIVEAYQALVDAHNAIVTAIDDDTAQKADE